MATVSADKRRGTDKARAQAKRKAAARSDKPRNYWTRRGPKLVFGREQFRLWWIPPAGKRVRIDEFVDSVTWSDTSAILTGEVKWHDPAYGAPPPKIGMGSEVMLECAITGNPPYRELWRMRVKQPFRSFKSGERTLQLQNVLGLLSASTDDFRYKRDKAHPKGWLAHEIVRDVCRRYGVPVGAITLTKHRIKKLVRLNASPLDVIAAAYKREKNYTGRRFVISCDHGKLAVKPLRRSTALLELGSTLIEASYQETQRGDFATALTLRGTSTSNSGTDAKTNKRRKPRKIMVKVRSATAIRKFGFVHRNITLSDVDSVAEANIRGFRRLATVARPLREVSLTHPGLPTLRRGDALRLLLPEPGLRQVVFVSGADHSLAGTYTMDLRVAFSDPYVDDRETRAAKKRNTAARKRGRKSDGSRDKPKQPAVNKNRQDKLTPGQRLSRRGAPR